MSNQEEKKYVVAAGFGGDSVFLRDLSGDDAYTDDVQQALRMDKKEAEGTRIDDEYVIELKLSPEGSVTAYRKAYVEDYTSLKGLNLAWGQVKSMHLAFGHPVKEAPTMLSAERLAARLKWVREELQEATDATTLVDQVDGHIDAIYFLLGNLVEMGVKPQDLFNIVQNANMGKLWPDGKPRFHPDGKIKKPDGWLEKYKPEPLLAEELDRQRVAHVNYLLDSGWVVT